AGHRHLAAVGVGVGRDPGQSHHPGPRHRRHRLHADGRPGPARAERRHRGPDGHRSRAVLGAGPGEPAERLARPRRSVGDMSATASSIEIERKYAVDAGFMLPDLSAVPGVAAVTGPRTYPLTAVYHDTPGQRLAAARITLRRRTGGTDSGWHLKLPGEAGGPRQAPPP